MNLNAEKVKLTQMILNIENKRLIQKIKKLILDEESDFWNELDSELQTEVILAIDELKNGKGVAHTEAMKKYKKWQKK
jgi:hypothetical protein